MDCGNDDDYVRTQTCRACSIVPFHCELILNSCESALIVISVCGCISCFRLAGFTEFGECVIIANDAKVRCFCRRFRKEDRYNTGGDIVVRVASIAWHDLHTSCFLPLSYMSCDYQLSGDHIEQLPKQTASSVNG